jgi:hypothetical protein
MPDTHRLAGIVMHQRIQPRDSLGRVDSVNGKIVLLSIGMSNCSYEFEVFKTLADADLERNPYVVVVNGAIPTNNAGVISKDTARYWSLVDAELRSSGVTRAQVQVVYLKNAHANVTAGFPEHADSLSRDFQSIVRIIKSRMRNVSATYVTGRSYGGYAPTGTLSPEPIAYETGFAVRWMIERQIAGDTALRYMGPQAPAPWLAWAPYLWADGMNPRSDGLTWSIDEFESDRTHTNAQGRMKVAEMLLDYFHNNPFARRWYLRPQSSSVGEWLTAPLELDLR